MESIRKFLTHEVSSVKQISFSPSPVPAEVDSCSCTSLSVWVSAFCSWGAKVWVPCEVTEVGGFRGCRPMAFIRPMSLSVLHVALLVLKREKNKYDRKHWRQYIPARWKHSPEPLPVSTPTRQLPATAQAGPGVNGHLHLKTDTPLQPQLAGLLSFRLRESFSLLTHRSSVSDKLKYVSLKYHRLQNYLLSGSPSSVGNTNAAQDHKHTYHLSLKQDSFFSWGYSLYPFPHLDLLVCQHHTWMLPGRHFCLFQSDKRNSLFPKANNRNRLKAH